MATFTRKNAWNNSGTFSNPDLLWYARGVGEMQSRSLEDPTSWWFFAAIHGQYATNEVNSGTPPPSGFPNWANIPGVPKVPVSPLPSSDLLQMYWDQCQHGTWFFPPWHRGYLLAIENVLRTIIKGLGGPSDWALPYWNYFGEGDDYKIPPAFTQQALTDDSANPLYVTARYGPNGDGNIFIPIPPVSQACQKDTSFYAGVQPNYYGGNATGFANSDNLPGALEWNPHNKVHTRVGGNSIDSPYSGLMTDPGMAGLDPIFYLHHCNIDRMWAAWNEAGKSNPVDPDWLSGPTATADRKFFMPRPDKTSWQFTPEMVSSISKLDYTYDDLSLGMESEMAGRNVLRLRNLALLSTKKNITVMESNKEQELVGANNAPLELNASGARTTVKLDSGGWGTVTKSLANASKAILTEKNAAANLPDEVYLQLEGVKGTADANNYTVAVNHQYAGDISLFGLRKASMKDSHHGGAGLTIRLDITDIIDKLHLSNNIDINSLDVLIQPSGPTAKGGEVTVDRISIYRKGIKSGL